MQVQSFFLGFLCMAEIHCKSERFWDEFFSWRFHFALNLSLKSKEKFLLDFLNETLKITPKYLDGSDTLEVNKKVTRSTKLSFCYLVIIHGTKMREEATPLKQKSL